MVVLTIFILGACGKVEVQELPDSSTLGNPQGHRIARVITHYHSPYSYDACDQKGFSNGVLNQECLNDLRKAICLNRIDALFLSDHPHQMENFEIPELVLKTQGDRLLGKSSDGVTFANQVSDCESGFRPNILAGFEGRILALGMTRHLTFSIKERAVLYQKDTFELRDRLSRESDAIVFIPHTESRSIETIRSLAPDGIEIYNIHANLDPKIRKRDLGISPFEHLPDVLTYLVDPYRSLHPDYMFMHFVEIHPIYFKKWNELIYSHNLKLAGFGGTDSHENIFPQRVADGERLDSHRRMTRFMSNHLIVPDLEPSSIKTALKQGRGWLVFEGFGTPIHMDFSAKAEKKEVGVGETLKLQGGRAQIKVRLPFLHPETPQGTSPPWMRVELKKIIAGGQDKVVASTENSDLSWETNEPGAYRAEIWIRPLHLREFLDDFRYLADREYRWIVTNHLYLED